jgi:deazaflavin-dependent oxidoreductase (nitroreductase family)
VTDADQFIADLKPFFDDHLRRYLADGLDGHYIDGRPFGGPEKTSTLLLKTIGRKSGKEYITPLIYDLASDEYIIIASNGGRDFHPAWFSNLTEKPDVRFQVAEDRYEGTWRVAEGDERAKLWSQMTSYYPPYNDYETRTDRRIPVVLLRADRKIEKL